MLDFCTLQFEVCGIEVSDGEWCIIIDTVKKVIELTSKLRSKKPRSKCCKNGKVLTPSNHVFFDGNLEAEKNKQAVKLNLSPGHKTCFDLIIACWLFLFAGGRKKRENHEKSRY